MDGVPPAPSALTGEQFGQDWQPILIALQGRTRGDSNSWMTSSIASGVTTTQVSAAWPESCASSAPRLATSSRRARTGTWFKYALASWSAASGWRRQISQCRELACPSRRSDEGCHDLLRIPQIPLCHDGALNQKFSRTPNGHELVMVVGTNNPVPGREQAIQDIMKDETVVWLGP
ncbi:hypothetical protein VP1G_11472 [Cytospora mali]|uniref:Uncharacterized protein n=1 Tax=Cytospora mali TaxID=578113 RepID=A0A194VG22_CYTMA|nr:hypothetical protein VP1G_11472 [Valsa mali var. pyri (nom. inval.)]